MKNARSVVDSGMPDLSDDDVLNLHLFDDDFIFLVGDFNDIDEKVIYWSSHSITLSMFAINADDYSLADSDRLDTR
jgi:hypothetical protein